MIQSVPTSLLIKLLKSRREIENGESQNLIYLWISYQGIQILIAKSTLTPLFLC